MICSKCGKEIENDSKFCRHCGASVVRESQKKKEPSKGLEVRSGVLKGLGICNDSELVVPDGVFSIADGAFWGCKRITSVILPESVKSIGKDAFKDCINLKNMEYNGNADQWNKVEKGSGWNDNMPCDKIRSRD